MWIYGFMFCVMLLKELWQKKKGRLDKPPFFLEFFELLKKSIV